MAAFSLQENVWKRDSRIRATPHPWQSRKKWLNVLAAKGTQKYIVIKFSDFYDYTNIDKSTTNNYVSNNILMFKRLFISHLSNQIYVFHNRLLHIQMLTRYSVTSITYGYERSTYTSTIEFQDTVFIACFISCIKFRYYQYQQHYLLLKCCYRI